ncbi:MAG: pantoate--beta-alanine ligase [Candidatus Thiodiazotropha endolucinida]|uniref:Pantothenate synthetase n=1 Tax=Candidatus Thiodiazotropha taylori TaxID=2792791 RepID=A0A9E4KDE3_9GAMM|nr:pantoate--beta-alanine ligase [Candidatus Thiodiazotropha taylori]MCG8028630.1 pantoate--beta-alanine ligase [Candidatus Thiodiazotropha taylori]MCG8042424.1 pantoate--beta-alanine ligase [Candidatus Thiodiazotropha taylori]MCG8050700.1 pantoate--beta-alanine ligase [Candidatus Thiodiazotropha taylori]MCG8056577.1 pantoate--beta-alanine ligase [Candidatus Thiodiazotropha taylori]
MIHSWRSHGEKIGFVPTMGNLHSGHLALVTEAKRRARRVVVSIFVNPLQFGEGEDFEDYPRTLEADKQQLLEAGVDLLFAPTPEVVYPAGQAQQTRVEVPEISDVLCGASRPGHFIGVATVVCKLFNMVQPDLSVFGEKDFQQLMVIRRMVADLSIPVDVLGLKTVREEDGLAKSSRNGYLNEEQRQTAPQLFRVMQQTAKTLAGGERDFARVEAEAQQQLLSAGFQPDYYVIRNADDLALPTETDSRLVILAAAHLGTTRLIDNLLVE